MFRIEGTGKHVAARMQKLGYWKKGQPQVSRFSEERGFVPSYVYRWLAGETPRGERLFRLAEALETDPKLLVTLPTTIRRIKKSLVSLVAVVVGVGTAGMAWAKGDTLPRPLDATRYLLSEIGRRKRRYLWWGLQSDAHLGCQAVTRLAVA